MKQKSLLILCAIGMLIAFGSQSSFAQGVTTARMNGTVTDASGAGLPGATVIAVHVPTGARYGNVTDRNGFYRIVNMKAGGPYTVTTTFTGFESSVRNGVYLTLGQAYKLNFTMSEGATELDEVVVTAGSGQVFDGNRTGSETVIGQRQINNMPSASRSIRDFARLTPQVQIREGNDGFSLSIGGQNNRYNAIYIDGGVNNDVFGLAGSGTNGGQTGVNPFSVDAIESFQVSLAPFDVRVSGFSGGAINAITRSGTNDIEGSAYYFVRNQSFAGSTPKDLRVDGEKQKLADFSAKTYGFRVGGPIIKDKAFFFVNYERQEDETPQPFTLANYTGDTDAAGLTTLRNFVNSNYNYDIGDPNNVNRTLESNKITAKFNFNLGDDHKLAVKYSLVDADNLEARSSGINNIGFSNGSELFKTTTQSVTVELGSAIGSTMANNLIIGYTSVRDDRTPLGNPFPTVFIADGKSNSPGDGEGITFGAEPFSTANLLDQDIFTFTNNFDIFKGRHTITIGTHNEYSRVKNLFFAFNYGQYEYSSVDDFVTDQAPRIYQRGYSLLSDGIGDGSTGFSEFSLFQLGLYVQDEFQVNDNLKLSAGIRVDMPFWADGKVNEEFNSTTIPLLEAAGKDLQGAQVGTGVNTTPHISPRIGFNWNVNGESNTQVRGGLGVFTSRVPLVWPGGTYNNNGATGGFNFRAFFLGNNNIGFEPDVTQQPVGARPGNGGREGNVDLFAPDFKLPSVLKFNLAVDQKLPFWGLIGSADFIYNKNISAVYYENINIGDAVGTLTGTGDNRSRYSRSAVDGTYGRIMLASNTSEGYSWNTAFTVRKPFSNGLDAMVSYSYSDSKTIFEGTSSQNSSQWRNHQTVNGKNSVLPLTRSDFAGGHRLQVSTSYKKEWTESLKTTFALYYEMSQDGPVSYVYQEGRDIFNDDSRDNALIYVPLDQNDIILEEGANGLTAQQQWNALDEFISSNDHLKNKRGRYSERNGFRGPTNHTVDFKLLQEFAVDKNRIQISVDIFNFLNFINADWGQRRFVSSGEVGLLRTENVADQGDGTFVPTFSFDPTIVDRIQQVDDAGIESSRWQMQVGVRYIFGN